MIFLNRQVITDGVMTGTSVLESIPLNLQQMSRASLQVVWTGTPTGVLKLQGSNNESDFVDIKEVNDVINNPAGAAGDLLLDINDISFKMIRLIYTNASGTGTLNVYAHAKGV